MITISSHEPFDNVNRYFHTALFTDLKSPFTRDYFKSISYVDGALKDFVSSVKKMRKNAYIFIYGDHTPYVINEEPYQRAHFTYEDRDFELVPLFIITPDEKKYYEKSKVASYLDLAPTVLSAVGHSFAMRTDGIDLLKTPIPDKDIPFKGSHHSRELLFKLAEDIPKYNQRE